MFSFIKNKADRDAAQQQLNLVLAYKRMFGSDDGKLILKDLMSITGVTMLSVEDDVYKTYFNEGKRSVGMHILTLMGYSEKRIEQLFRDKYSDVFEEELE